MVLERNLSVMYAAGKSAGVFLILGLWVMLPLSAYSQTADLIITGKHIITMDVGTAGAQAVAIANGHILAVGPEVEVLALRGDGTRLIALDEQALLPGFIDAHGHLLAQASLLDLANLSPPPLGAIVSIADLQSALGQYISSRAIPTGEWVVGFGYDDSLLFERRHPNRDDLDAVSTDHPIFLIHASGHLGVANSAALVLLDINSDAQNPPGGNIRRIKGTSVPDGVLEETAAFAAYRALPKPSVEESLRQLVDAQHYYAANGITTAQEGGATADNVEILNLAAEQGKLFLDVVAYSLWIPGTTEFSMIEKPGDYHGRFRVGGIKLVLDGSPQGKTAYLSEPYYVVPAGQQAGYRGYPAYPDATVTKAVGEILAAGTPLLVHANGDAAAGQLIDAVEVAGQSLPVADMRVVMIHAQTVRDDQLDRMAVLGMVPSFFSAHTFYWGDWHRESVLGPERADRISPTASAVRRGMVFTVHNDAPITPPRPIELIWSTVNRRTRSGDILGPGQRVGTAEALKAVTIHAAYQYFEEDSKGSITPGKWADLVILSASPLDVQPELLNQLEVVETFSHGQSVFRKEGNSAVATP